MMPNAPVRPRRVAAWIDTEQGWLVIDTSSRRMTHACVAGAARGAVPAGFNVIVAADACATRAIVANAHQMDHKLLHEAALVTIADTFGAVLSTDEVLALGTATKAA